MVDRLTEQAHSGKKDRQLNDLAFLYETSAAISGSLDIDRVLRTTAANITKALGADGSGICLWDHERDAVVTLHAYTSKPNLLETDAPGTVHSLAERAACRAVLTELDSLVLHRGDPAIDVTDRAWMADRGIQAMLIVPLVVRGEAIGSLELLEGKEERVYTPFEISLCETLANQAAAALENARLYEQAQRDLSERRRAEEQLLRRNRELALLNRVIAASAAYPTVIETLEVVCKEMALAFGVPQAAAAMFNTARTEATVVAEFVEEGRPKSLGAKLTIANNFFYQFLMQHKAPLVAEEAQTDPRLERHHRLLKRRGTLSLLLVPILIDGQVMGSLGVEAIEPRTFHPEEVLLAQRVAEQVSGCLTRARLQEGQQHLERQLRQMHKMEALGHMAGGIAHDFNNLLTIIHISVQLLERGISPGEPLWEPLSHIRDAGQRAAALTSRLLSFSRREVIKPRRADLNHMVTSLRSSLKRITGNDVDLVFGLTDGLWPIRVDLVQMDQVIVNLVVNATAAMPDGGVLTIETKNIVLDHAYAAVHLDVEPGEYVELAISDTGAGMDEQAKAHLFEPFFTPQDRNQSTGMGLATVYGIVTQNKGHIRVYSEETLGTTIRIYLPRAREEGEPAPELPSEFISSLQGTETILLAEDEASVLNLAAKILRDHGYNVLTASNGLEALEISNNYGKPIDLLLTDVVMPHMNGRELAEQLLLQRPGTRVLYISGYTDNVIMRHGVLGPGMAFMAKPLGLDSLTRKVRAVLDGPA